VSNEYDGTVSVIDTAAHSVTTTIGGLGGQLGDLASHPEGMISDPVRDRIYVAGTNRDLLAAIATKTGAVGNVEPVGRRRGGGGRRAGCRHRAGEARGHARRQNAVRG